MAIGEEKKEMLTQNQLLLLILKLMLICSMEDMVGDTLTMGMDMLATTVLTDTATGEEKRGRLKLNQLLILMLILKLTLTCTMVVGEDMAGDTHTMDMDMLATTVLTDMATGEEKRGRLKLNQLPILMLILKLMPTCIMVDGAMATDIPTMDMDTQVTTAHGDTATGEES